MREYETTVIVQPEISDEGSQTLLEKLDGILATEGATRLMCEDLGKRKLAYEVRKFHKGHYYILYFLDGGKAIPELERILRMDESILRFMTVQVNDDVTDIEARCAAAREAELAQEKRAEERADREAEDAKARIEADAAAAAAAEASAAAEATAKEADASESADAAESSTAEVAEVAEVVEESPAEPPEESAPTEEPAAEAEPSSEAAEADGEGDQK